MPARKFAKLWILTPVILLIVATFVFYYLDDYLDDGKGFAFLDAYNQGFLTWWLDVERFLGGLELWTVVGLWMGYLPAMYVGSSEKIVGQDTKKSIGSILVAIMILVTTSLVFSFFQIPVKKDISPASILLSGWYPEYFPSHLLFFLICISGCWALILKLSVKFKNRMMVKANFKGQLILLLMVGLVFHLVVISDWSPGAILNLEFLIIDLAGFHAFLLPLFTFFMAILESRGKGTGHPRARSSIAPSWKSRDFKVILYISASSALVIVFIFIMGIKGEFNASIDIKSDIIPRNVLSWTYCAMIATVAHVLTSKGDKNA